jgi:hypothetical protein
MLPIRIGDDDQDASVRISTMLFEDAATPIAFSLFVVLTATLIATFCIPQYFTHSHSVDLEGASIFIGPQPCTAANSFVWLAVQFAADLRRPQLPRPLGLNLTLRGSAPGGAAAAVNLALRATLSFANASAGSPLIPLFSAHVRGNASYSGRAALDGDLSGFASATLLWRIGHPRMCYFVRAVKIFAIVVFLCAGGFFIESLYCGDRAVWTARGAHSVVLLLLFVPRLCFWDFWGFPWIRFAANVAFYFSLRYGIVTFIRYVRRDDSPSALREALLVAALLICEAAGNGFFPVAPLWADQLTVERRGYQAAFGVEFGFACLVLWQFWVTHGVMDGSQAAAFAIYAVFVAVLEVVSAAARFLQGFVVPFMLVGIPEVAVVTVQFVYVVAMLYLHWPRGEVVAAEFVEGSDVAAVKGGASLIDDA